jgi:hypothetical protein
VKKEIFPQSFRSGSVTVKIYRVKKRAAAAAVVYAMAWVDPARGRLNAYRLRLPVQLLELTA